MRAEIEKLEEENRKLKEANKNLIIQRDAYCKDYEKFVEENKTLYKKLQEIGENNFELKKENKNLKLTLEQMENTCKDYINDRDTLREENKKLKEKLSEITMVSDDEKQSIEHILELEKENRLLKDKLNAFESSKFNTMALLEIQHPKTAREAENLLQYKKVFERLYNDRLYCLEEENRKLKEELDKFSEAYKRYRDYEKEELAESCYDLARENDRLKQNAMEDMRVQTKLEEGNKKLKERIEELEQCNLNLQTWIDNKEKVNKSLREEIKDLNKMMLFETELEK